MRAPLILASSITIAILSSGASEAIPLAFNGTLSVTLGVSSSESDVFLATGSGIGDSSGGPGTFANIPANVFAINQSVMTSLGGPTDVALCAPGIPSGTVVTVPSANAACASPLTNNALMYFGATGSGGLNGSLYPAAPPGGLGSPQTGEELPLSPLGAGGTVTIPGGVFQAATITGGLWTVGGVQSAGMVNGQVFTLTGTGFDNRAADGTGTLQLAVPGGIMLLGATFPLIGVVTLDFLPVPEPSTALLLGSGIAGLVMLGRRRMRE